VWRCKHTAPLPEDVRRAVGVLERRHALSILLASYQGCTRFNEFRQALRDIPPGTLAQRLLELEQAGVFRRDVTDARPPRVEYVLTRDGARLGELVEALVAWARA
jgi:DNA-binding HxlR family transcriptional regulator